MFKKHTHNNRGDSTKENSVLPKTQGPLKPSASLGEVWELGLLPHKVTSFSLFTMQMGFECLNCYALSPGVSTLNLPRLALTGDSSPDDS